jgi:hypothetical protein
VGASCSLGVLVHLEEPGEVENRVWLESSATHVDEARFVARGQEKGMTVSGDLRFGRIRVGTTRDLTVSVRAVTDAGLTGVHASVAGGPQFSVLENACAGVTLARDSGCEITIRYAPTSVGTHTATITALADDVEPLDVEVKGLADEPVPVVTPDAIPFGIMEVGDVEDVEVWVDTLTVPFTVTDVSVTGSAFSVRNDACTDRLVDFGCRLFVRAAPTQARSYSGRLRFETDAGVTLDVPLSVTTNPRRMTLTPTSISVTAPTGGSTDFEIMVTNVGTSHLPMRGTSLATGSYPGGRFTVTSNECFQQSLLPGGTCIVALTFTAGTDIGAAHEAEVSIFNSGGHQVVALTGRTVAPNDDLEPGVPRIENVTVRPLRTGRTPSSPWTARIAWTRDVPLGIDASGTTYEIATRPASGGSWRTVHRGRATTADIPVLPGRVDIRIRATNKGHASYRTITTDRSVADLRTASSRWTRLRDRSSLGGAVMRARSSRAKAGVERSMRGLAIVARTSRSRGVFDVYVNGDKVDRVELAPGDPRWRRVVWQRTFSSRTTRHVEVRVISGRVEIDGWIIER